MDIIKDDKTRGRVIVNAGVLSALLLLSIAASSCIKPEKMPEEPAKYTPLGQLPPHKFYYEMEPKQADEFKRKANQVALGTHEEELIKLLGPPYHFDQMRTYKSPNAVAEKALVYYLKKYEEVGSNLNHDQSVGFLFDSQGRLQAILSEARDIDTRGDFGAWK